ncbi:MAG: hypothetical protein K2W95_23860 [Candidatus Obscuribacterales bacterium]|nr:hypothetical protein [Candidatus Obscuribacterales bacterium]
MKLVVAFIQPFMLDRVTRLLRQRAACFFVSEVRAYDAGCEEAELVPRVRLEVPVNNDMNAMAIADLISQTVNTGRAGDGVVMVTELSYAINVDSGRRGTEVFDY